jgi:hypothetical protein
MNAPSTPEVGVHAPALEDMLEHGRDGFTGGALKLEGGDLILERLSRGCWGLTPAEERTRGLSGVVIDTALAPSWKGLVVAVAAKSFGSEVDELRCKALDASFAASSC